MNYISTYKHIFHYNYIRILKISQHAIRLSARAVYLQSKITMCFSALILFFVLCSLFFVLSFSGCGGSGGNSNTIPYIPKALKAPCRDSVGRPLGKTTGNWGSCDEPTIDYFPLNPGSWWQYEFSWKSATGTTWTETGESVINANQKLDISNYYNSYATYYNSGLTGTNNIDGIVGRGLLYYLWGFAVNATGYHTYYAKLPDVKDKVNKVLFLGYQMDTSKYTLTYPYEFFYNFPLDVGCVFQSYKFADPTYGSSSYDARVLSKDTQTVTAGTFDRVFLIQVTSEVNTVGSYSGGYNTNYKYTERTWLAPNVGIIKYQYEVKGYSESKTLDSSYTANLKSYYINQTFKDDEIYLRGSVNLSNRQSSRNLFNGQNLITTGEGYKFSNGYLTSQNGGDIAIGADGGILYASSTASLSGIKHIGAGSLSSTTSCPTDSYTKTLNLADMNHTGHIICVKDTVGAYYALQIEKHTYSANMQTNGNPGDFSFTWKQVTGGTVQQNKAPISNAGMSQTVTTGTQVTLDGSASYDPDGDTLTYVWTQTSGPTVTLSSTSISRPYFTPTQAGTYIFQLMVSDGKLMSSASSVTITVNEKSSEIENCPNTGVCLKIADITGSAGGSAVVSIKIQNASSVGSVQINLEFDSTKLSITPKEGSPNEADTNSIYVTGGIAAGSMVPGNIGTAGLVKIGLMNATGFSGTGDMVYIKFNIASAVAKGQTKIIFSTSPLLPNSLSDTTANTITFTTAGGSITVQ